MEEFITLYRPIGLQELELIAQTDYREFPPRLPEQPIFYPVLDEKYAALIARYWSIKHESRVNYVTRIQVKKEFLDLYEVQFVGSSVNKEYRIPAEDLPEFNRNIVGKIEVIAEFHP